MTAVTPPAHDAANDLPITVAAWKDGEQPPVDTAETGLAFREGDIIADKYRFERVLGVGGMGAVLQATHLQLRRHVALKFMLPGIADNAQAIVRFKREARAAASIRSEHVGRVLDIDNSETGDLFIVMEYLEGESLGRVLEQRGTLPPAKACMLIVQACAAIGEAHEAGIVHRDLKPSNLFLTYRRDGTPCIKVLDFGVAKFRDGPGADLSLTHTQTMIGSPRYMSPEQLLTPRNVDGRADIWSLGVILYQLLGGQSPFDADTVPNLIARVLNERPAPLSSLVALPRGLESVVETCLRRDREERYKTAGELAAALEPFALRGASSSVRWRGALRWWPAAAAGVVAAGIWLGVALAGDAEPTRAPETVEPASAARAADAPAAVESARTVPPAIPAPAARAADATAAAESGATAASKQAAPAPGASAEPSISNEPAPPRPQDGGEVRRRRNGKRPARGVEDGLLEPSKVEHDDDLLEPSL